MVDPFEPSSRRMLDEGESVNEDKLPAINFGSE